MTGIFEICLGRAGLVFILSDVTRFAGFSRRLVQQVLSLVFDFMFLVSYYNNNCNLNHWEFMPIFSKYNAKERVFLSKYEDGVVENYCIMHF